MSKDHERDNVYTAFSIGARNSAEKRFPNGTVDWFEPIDFTIDYDSVKLLELVAKGSYGTVYKSLFNNSIVAAKLEDFHENDEEQVNLLVELTMLQSFPHDRLVKFIGAGCLSKRSAIHTERKLMIVMEYCERGALRECLRENIPWNLRTRIALDIANGISFLHDNLIIHRDVKSTNVLIDKDWRAKLCDFSFACHNESTSKLDVTYGTDEFMSPEMACALDFDMSADIFSYGIVLCELITNREPSSEFLCRRPQDFFAVDEKEINSAILPECPSMLKSLTLMCCNIEPSKRPVAYTCIDKLTEILHDLGGAIFEFNPPMRSEINVPSPFREGKVRTSVGGGHLGTNYNILHDNHSATKIGEFPQPYALVNNFNHISTPVRFSPGKYQSLRYLNDESVMVEKMVNMEKQILELQGENLRLKNNMQSILTSTKTHDDIFSNLAHNTFSNHNVNSSKESNILNGTSTNEDKVYSRLIELEQKVGMINGIHLDDKSMLIACINDQKNTVSEIKLDTSNINIKKELEQIYNLKSRLENIAYMLEENIHKNTENSPVEFPSYSIDDVPVIISNKNKKSPKTIPIVSKSNFKKKSMDSIKLNHNSNTKSPLSNSTLYNTTHSTKREKNKSINNNNSSCHESNRRRDSNVSNNSNFSVLNIHETLQYFLQAVQNSSQNISRNETQEIIDTIEKTFIKAQNFNGNVNSNNSLDSSLAVQNASFSRYSCGNDILSEFTTPQRTANQSLQTMSGHNSNPNHNPMDRNHKERNSMDSFHSTNQVTPLSALQTWRNVNQSIIQSSDTI